MYINGNSFPPAHKSNKLAAQDELDLPTSRPRESAEGARNARDHLNGKNRKRTLRKSKDEQNKPTG